MAARISRLLPRISKIVIFSRLRRWSLMKATKMSPRDMFFVIRSVLSFGNNKRLEKFLLKSETSMCSRWSIMVGIGCNTTLSSSIEVQASRLLSRGKSCRNFLATSLFGKCPVIFNSWSLISGWIPSQNQDASTLGSLFTSPPRNWILLTLRKTNPRITAFSWESPIESFWNVAMWSFRKLMNWLLTLDRFVPLTSKSFSLKGKLRMISLRKKASPLIFISSNDIT